MRWKLEGKSAKLFVDWDQDAQDAEHSAFEHKYDFTELFLQPFSSRLHNKVCWSQSLLSWVLIRTSCARAEPLNKEQMCAWLS